ncbi:acyl transferase domain-containing protein [Macrophomina phaseolina]|uniref:Acyl transferase domain-containing protein n=1 Tax=Macrophomina phaseolina TaxID=35725 RepID=A0ABQ8G8A2_9PEZI|nr:acyl transferase domain-containing protein [Macrophomina phaseolina]
MTVSSPNARSSTVRPPNARLCLAHGGIQHTLSVSLEHYSLLAPHTDAFLNELHADGAATDHAPAPHARAALALRFIQHLVDEGITRSAIGELLTAFEKDFLSDIDIHSLAFGLQGGLLSGEQLVRVYYAALAYCSKAPADASSALLRAARDGQARLLLVFGGQGMENAKCVQELRKLHATYAPLLSTLIAEAAAVLSRLCRHPRTKGFYYGREIDLPRWLGNAEAENVPDRAFMASAAVSVPVIGVLSLAHYCVSCAVLGMTPSQLRSHLRGVTGHSQGLIVAAGIAQSDTWESFYSTAREVITFLFWTGFDAHISAPRSGLTGIEIADCVKHGEGEPSHMLSVRGLRKAEVNDIVQRCNAALPEQSRLYVALQNAADNFVVAGPARSLRGLCLHLREIKAGDGEEQSTVPYGRRKKLVKNAFLPISAPFHSPYLERVRKRLREHTSNLVSLNTTPFGIPVYHTLDGRDIRKIADRTLTEILADAAALDPVDWPAALDIPDITHMLVLSSGFGGLVATVKQGQGVCVVNAADPGPPHGQRTSKCDLFAPQLPQGKLVPPPSWREAYGPRLRKTPSGNVVLDTSFTRLVGAPPVMAAGMTPTTTHADVVAAILNAGYHAELAAGGFRDPGAMALAIQQVVEAVPAGRSIACNVIYASPEALRWQISLLKELRRSGRTGPAVDGLTIGAGVPSLHVASEYIRELGLRYIALKPGSVDAITRTLAIADAHPHFPIVLQWTGGRGGGHHSCEDFHAPMLATYHAIRRRPNVVLLAGSGFGDAAGAYPYLTGEWARRFNGAAAAPMPFDGILLGSRMMVAREAHTSPQSKRLIVGARGVGADGDWAAGDAVVSVRSEMGQPIHKLATRGARLWAELDETVFALPRAQRACALAAAKEALVARLNADYARPWFGVDARGRAVDVGDMAYARVLDRLIALTYVAGQRRWVDPSYRTLVLDVARRALDRLAPGGMAGGVPSLDGGDDATGFAAAFVRACPEAAEARVHPEDVRWFVRRCKVRGGGIKPVPFVPVLDEDFEYFFKKDSLWQSEDVDAVVGRDAGRVCILQGPVSVEYARSTEQSAKEILDGIHDGLVERLMRDQYGGDEKNIPSAEEGSDPMPTPGSLRGVDIEDDGAVIVFRLAASNTAPSAGEWLQFMAQRTGGWVQALCTDEYILQGKLRTPNPFRQLLQLRPGERIEFNRKELRVTIYKDGFDDQKLCCFSCSGSSVEAKFWTMDLSSAGLVLHFSYHAANKGCRLAESANMHSGKTRALYQVLWLPGKPLPEAGRLRSTFEGPEMVITEERIESLVFAVNLALPDLELGSSCFGEVIPLDACIALAWEPLVQPLLLPEVDGDLLRLVHRSNKFEYLSDATPLKIGDSIKTISQVQAVTIDQPGKSVVVRAVISRGLERVVAVTSEFLFRGAHSDYDSTFKKTTYPDLELRISSALDEAILRDREWLVLDDDAPASLINHTLVFSLESAASRKDKHTFRSLSTHGPVFSRSSPSGRCTQIGRVAFAAQDCRGDPVVDFLTRKARPRTPRVPLPSPGWIAEATHRDVRMPATNDAYAAFSRDVNPIHTSPAFAALAGLPGPVTHGMYTSAVVRTVLERAIVAGGSTAGGARFRSFDARFVGMVAPGDVLRVSFAHVAMEDGTMVFSVQARKLGSGGSDADGELVLEGEALIEQPRTAYVFTGQGSQVPGMGAKLCAESAVAREVWDLADRYLSVTYGWSMYDIVQANPTTLTVHFGGLEGRRIRDNYLALATAGLQEGVVANQGNGRRPILPGLTRSSRSYTFSHPSGLLFSTQFAQPAIVLLELATFEDMRARGLVQKDALFAGHSLGEYGALTACAGVFPVEKVMEMMFFRGLAMQAALERDTSGCTDYGMVAVSPNRVGPGFDEKALRGVVDAIITASQGALLEIVNLNIAGEQYVCAGTLQNLYCLGRVLDHLFDDGKMPSSIAKPLDCRITADSSVISLAQRYVKEAQDLRQPITVTQGRATISLKGIDVPFHSSVLRSGVQHYREFLQRSINFDVDVEKLSGKYIPNLTAKPFTLKPEYLQETYAITGRPVLTV